MRIAVYGLWHLGCVTAAGLAEAGHDVIGLDEDAEAVAALRQGRAPLHEPGLDDLIAKELAAGRLSFTTEVRDALARAEVVWITLDTPVDDQDEADVRWVRERIERLRPEVRPDMLVLLSSQVPVGFTAALASDWASLGVDVAYSPENLRLGQALERFRHASRTVVGTTSDRPRARLEALLGPFCERLLWMSAESAEMSKHAVNAFLATSAVFANELARIGERLGADARAVQLALKTEPRIGPGAYVAPGPPLAGGTLPRDLRYLSGFGRALGVPTPLLSGVLESDDRHRDWVREVVIDHLPAEGSPCVTLLGLTYKAGTSTLRRSPAIALAKALASRGVDLRAHDPAVKESPADFPARLVGTPREALSGADVAVVLTPWPALQKLGVADFVDVMRRPCVVDPTWCLAERLAQDGRVEYFAPGQPRGRRP
jgi:UDPglucose 6-dehydrogenase